MLEASTKKSLLVQGWTGINHSYAMVNQYQLLAMVNQPDMAIYSQQMPLYDERWTKEKMDSGFTAAEQAQLGAISAYEGQQLSATYRIHSPNTLALSNEKVITFVVTELGLDAQSFALGADVHAYTYDGNLIVTPSNWSRDRILEFGFSPESVFVVPHGVDTQKFFPMTHEERTTARANLGYNPDDVVFLNVGAPIWNKGMDLLIEAFFATRQTCKNARLLIKDQQAVYGLSAAAMIRDLNASGRIAVDNDSVESIRVLPQTLSLGQLRGLYGIADYYVSPYRAEGFNLPVIEAAACGTPVIVTDGGSTDDFCNPYIARKIPSVLLTNTLIQNTRVGAYLQPDLDALVETMRTSCQTVQSWRVNLAFGREDLVECFTWRRAARMIGALA